MSFKLHWPDGMDDDEFFDTREEAEEYALVQISNYHTGGEVLHLSNPGDYPEGDGEDPEYEITEV
ncbi:MAG: hypothetical protein U1E32_02150 [Rhodoglobus sp.]|jgi:hypothetical protein|nr:hypothetical protein [Rhodoglobus sp.]